MSKLITPKDKKLSPIKISVNITTRNGFDNVGYLNWTGDIWEFDGEGFGVINDIFINGMSYGGKVYTLKDHELYLPLIRSRYSGIFFDIVK